MNMRQPTQALFFKVQKHCCLPEIDSYWNNIEKQNRLEFTGKKIVIAAGIYPSYFLIDQTMYINDDSFFVTVMWLLMVSHCVILILLLLKLFVFISRWSK